MVEQCWRVSLSQSLTYIVSVWFMVQQPWTIWGQGRGSWLVRHSCSISIPFQHLIQSNCVWIKKRLSWLCADTQSSLNINMHWKRAIYIECRYELRPQLSPLCHQTASQISASHPESTRFFMLKTFPRLRIPAHISTFLIKSLHNRFFKTRARYYQNN